MVKEFVIDLFCGAGGTSTGVHLSNGHSKVIFCVNHDRTAIESHRENHPNAKHLVEDIRNPEVLFFLKLRVDALRKLFPKCIITFWASLECTNFSKAKGGLPRNADSRTLADYLDKYVELANPDYLMIENVVEFMCWGPLDENNKPISRKKGKDFMRWIDHIKGYGYKEDHKEINAANLGAYTSRNRLFMQFTKPHLPIAWPQPTHAKDPQKTDNLFGQPLKKWKAVKEVLDFTEEGVSIFNRKKPLVENTLKRIYAGLLKFVANGDVSFIKKYFSGRPKGKVISVLGPAGTITTFGSQALVNCNFILKYNSTNKNGKHIPPSVNEPCPTVAAQNRLGVVKANFFQSYYGTGGPKSFEQPCPTLTTKDRFACIFLTNYYSGGGQLTDIEGPSPTITNIPKSRVTKCYFLDQQYGNSKPKSIETPSGAIPINPKESLTEVFIFNPQFSNVGNSIEKPCPVIIARQDKRPLGLIICDHSKKFAIPVYEDDNPTMIKIKQFMAVYKITDIKMRMFMIKELKRIQGFPENYVLKGTQTQQKKFIGNSVEVTTAKKLFEAHYFALKEYLVKEEAVA